MLKKWLDFEGPVFGFLDKTGQLIVLGVLWFLSCLPVVTAAAGTAALYYAVVKTVRRGRGRAVGEFFSSFKANLKRGTLAFLPVLALFALLAADIAILRGQGRFLHIGALVALMILLAGTTVYLGPVLSRFSVKMTRVWRLAFAMALRFWYFTAAILLCAVLLGALQFYVLPAPAALLLPGCACMAASFPIEKALRRYMPPREEGDDAWYYDE